MKTFTNPDTNSVFKVDDISRMIDDVLDSSESLTPWETGFMLNLHEKFEITKYITEKQLVVLERIYTEKTK